MILRVVADTCPVPAIDVHELQLKDINHYIHIRIRNMWTRTIDDCDQVQIKVTGINCC
jgi:hypothetical protein